MKKLLIILFLLGSTVLLSAQSAWKGFFKPIDKNMFVTSPGVFKAGTSQWKFRPAFELTAEQLTWDKTEKKLVSSSLQSGGIGISYSDFTNQNGVPYEIVGVNVLLLFNTPTTDVITQISTAVTCDLFQYFNFGAGYNFTIKTPFFLLGAVIHFN